MTNNAENEELEEIRKRKLAELQQAQQSQLEQQQQIEQTLAHLERMLRPLLTQEAWDQWQTAKIGNPNNAYITAQAIIASAQSGQIHGKLSREQIRNVLSAVGKRTRKEFTIRRI